MDPQNLEITEGKSELTFTNLSEQIYCQEMADDG